MTGPRTGKWLIAAACALAVAPASARGPTAPRSVHGVAPLPGNAPVPQRDRPPGSRPGDGGPSRVVFPPQRIAIRFDHRKHGKDLLMTCRSCHLAARTSQKSSDDLLPKPTQCDPCHLSNHRDPSNVTAGNGLLGQCGFCHRGYRPGFTSRVERTIVPRPNLRFDHSIHAARNIGCRQCHGEVQNLELATRDQLPRMRRCLDCHQRPAPARGRARGACSTCHPTRGGRLQTSFASGRLEPPRWLHGAGHGADWVERHEKVAASDSRFCGNCHGPTYCTDCHDGRVRPRSIHPNDWLSMHPMSARQNGESCTSCHRQQSFCLACHQRSGVTLSGPYANFARRGRFHPPKDQWTDPPRSSNHHAWEAQRNINACVSCHAERDCTICHATARVGGTGPGGAFGVGVNPHGPGFRSRCRTALRRNARPCLVCHDPQDPKLSDCR